MASGKQAVVYDDPNRCVKDDETGNGPCMCPECKKAAMAGSNPYVAKGVVLTDDNLVSGEAQQRIAYHFICAACHKDNVSDYMSYCPDCGTRVIIRSHKVMEFLRKHNAHQA